MITLRTGTEPYSSTILVLYISLSWLLKVSTQPLCPISCDCRTDRSGSPIVLDCRGRGLDRIPSNLPGTLVEIDLSNNDIRTLSRGDFPLLPNVRRLSMVNCQLEALEKHAFRNLPHLEILELSRNRIVRIHEDTFVGLTGLLELHLPSNQISSLPKYGLRALTLDTLDLSDNQLSRLNDLAFVASEIKTLKLDRNQLGFLDSGCLSSLSNSLRFLSITGNTLQLSIVADAFSSNNFDELRLSSSRIQDLSFLAHTRTRLLNLSGNQLDEASFPRSEKLRESCEELLLSSSKFNAFDSSFSYSLANIRTIDLHNNSMTSLYPTPSLPHLIHLDLSQNRISRLPDGFCQYLENLGTFNLSQSGLKLVSQKAFNGAVALKYLDLTFNGLQVMNEQTYRGLLDSVEQLNLTGNSFHCNCEMLWLRNWLDEGSRDVGFVRCVDWKTGKNENILDRPADQFLCTKAKIVSVTSSLNIDEGRDALLSCSATSDPASEVVWKSPSGELYSITPPADREVQNTYAAWHLSKIRREQSGWYSCTANNLAGKVISYAYVNVVNRLHPAVKLEGIEYPNVPYEELLTPPVVANASNGSSSSHTTRIPVDPNLILSTDSRGSKFTPKSPLDITPVSASPVEASDSHSGRTTPSLAADEESRKTGRIAIGVSVALFVIIAAVFLLLLLLLIQRRRASRRNGHYSVKRVHDESMNGNAPLGDDLPYATCARRVSDEALPLNRDEQLVRNDRRPLAT